MPKTKIYPPDGEDYAEWRRRTIPSERRVVNDVHAELLSALIKARKRSGLSQVALSAKTGVSQKAISQMESGMVSPNLSTLLKILGATGYTVKIARRITA